jgi:hypothetical protein
MLGEKSQILQKLIDIKTFITREVCPLIAQFEQMDARDKEFSKLHLKISELLMQSLLKVDSVDCQSDSEKLERKEMVKLIQGNLDAIDEIKHC